LNEGLNLGEKIEKRINKSKKKKVIQNIDGFYQEFHDEGIPV
jgi:hypothetical protein